MPNFEEIYCQRHHCDKGRFRRDLFWKCVPPHAIPLAWLFGGVRGSFFEADREMLAGVAVATRGERISDEVHDFFHHPANRRWLRRVLRIRMSTAKLRLIAQDYIAAVPAEAPDGGSNPPVPMAAPAVARR